MKQFEYNQQYVKAGIKMKLSELNKLINKNTKVIIRLHFDYKNCNSIEIYNCKWKEIEESKKNELTIFSMEPHENYLYIGVTI